MIKTGKRRGSVRQLSIKRVQNYMRNLPTDENGVAHIDENDLKNIADCFWGHNRQNNGDIIKTLTEEQEE